MGKRYYNLHEKIINPLNIWFAYKQAARGKRYRPAAAHFEYDLEKNLIALHQELSRETYQPGEYHNFYIQKPKRRLISAAPFRDRVVHHALMDVIEPLFERGFIFDSYANRKGKGTHKALDRCTYFLRRYQYVMHLDVRQFFYRLSQFIRQPPSKFPGQFQGAYTGAEYFHAVIINESASPFKSDWHFAVPTIYRVSS